MLKSSQNKNGKPGLGSLNNFRVWNLHVLPCLKIDAAVILFIYLPNSSSLSFIITFSLTCIDIIQYVIVILFFVKMHENSKNYGRPYSYLPWFIVAPGCRTSNIWSIKRSLLFRLLINIG